MVLGIQRRLAQRMRIRSHGLIKEFLGEMCGAATLLTFGLGIRAQTFLGDYERWAAGGLISTATGWGLAVMMGIFVAGKAGRGHINPGISLSMALIGKLSWNRVPIYILAHHVGAFLGSLLVYTIYVEKFNDYTLNMENGTLNVNTLGNVFFTKPMAKWPTCFMDMVISSALLAIGVNAIIDHRGFQTPGWFVPLSVGGLITILVGCFALNAGVPLNSARDLCPRLALALMGWGAKPFNAHDYYFWIPYSANFLGPSIGATMYELLIGMHMPGKPKSARKRQPKGQVSEQLTNKKQSTSSPKQQPKKDSEQHHEHIKLIIDHEDQVGG